MQEWADTILEVGSDQGYWDNPEIVQDEDRFRPGDSDLEELFAEYEKLNEETGWVPEISRREEIRRTIDWYANNPKAGARGWTGDD